MDNKKANKLFDEGYAYETGNGIAQNIDKAIEKYLEAGENGHADAICRAGYCYQYKLNRPDIEKAVNCYKQSIACHDNDTTEANGNAYVYLSICYKTGKGVEKSESIAEELMIKAKNLDAPILHNGEIMKYFSAYK